MQIYVFIMFGILLLTIGIMLVAKKRMDRNEPAFGWKRKQHLEETNSNASTSATVANSKGEDKKLKKERDAMKELIGIEDIKFGIYEQKNNEYCVVIETDSVNFDLLSETARQSIILAYSSLFRVIRFPLQILGQAVRQDLRKEEARWKQNLAKGNKATEKYGEDVIHFVKDQSENIFQISRKVFYVVSFIPQPSKMGALTLEKRNEMIRNELYSRAEVVRGQLRQCQINTNLLDSLKAGEVMKRALNRDRMIMHPIESLITHGKEKLSSYITLDVASIPDLERLVYDVQEVIENVKALEQEKESERI